MALNNDSEIKVYVTRTGREQLLFLVERRRQDLFRASSKCKVPVTGEINLLNTLKRELEQAGS